MNHKHLLPKLLRPLVATLLVLAVLLLASFQVTQAQAVRAAQANADIPCDQTPFGRVLDFGQENEIFMGFRNADIPNPGSLASFRFDQAKTTGQLLQQQLTVDANNARNNISTLAGTTADLDGDGKAEFVQAFTDANGNTQLVVNHNGAAQQSAINNTPNQNALALAAGDILGVGDGSQQVALASASNTGMVVYVYDNTSFSGSTAIAPAYWSSAAANRTNSKLVRVGVGNLDNDKYADIVLTFVQSDQQTIQVVDLEYQPGYIGNDGVTTAKNLQERASITFGPGLSYNDVQMTLANLHGDGLDSVVVAWNFSSDQSVGFIAWDFKPINGQPQFTNGGAASTGPGLKSISLASGDLYGDHRDEILVGYNWNGVMGVDTYQWSQPAGQNPSLVRLDQWQDGQNGRNNIDHLALTAGDLNKDNQAEVVAAFKDVNQFGGFQTLYLDADANHHLQLKDWSHHNPNINAAITLSLGDWDNDSLRAFVKGKCAQVVDADVTAANFIPPYWQNIQGSQGNKGGSLGQSFTQGTTVEQSLTYNRSNTVSAYVGGGAGGSVLGIVELSAVAKVTGGQEYAVSDKKTTSTGMSMVTTLGRSWTDDALVYEPAEYKCFSYQLAVANVFIPTDQAHLRYCEPQTLSGTTPLQASELNSWDLNFGGQPQYSPVVRDWSSLALFRGAFTDQSSNKSAAPLAVDSAIVITDFNSGTVAQTANENNPWWQVDLGSVQPISKIRLWTPKGSLANFYLFVSNTDFRTLPGQDNPANLLNQPGVQHYTLADLGNTFAMTDTAAPETTFLTLNSQHQPIQGQYVRIQRVGLRTLALAEVQVFGPNHVEPDRYPLDLRDTNPNDGYLEVLLYNPYHSTDNDAYVWTKIRGQLLWDGRQNASLNGLTIDRGNGILNWSLSNNTETSKVQAQEIANNTSIGAEFEVEAAAGGVKVVGGFATEQTYGIANEVVQGTAWGQEFNMGGQMQGFPPAYDGPENNWVVNCRYRFQPYYYAVTEFSNLGYRLHFPVLDYLVPDGGFSLDLHRTTDLTACRNGNLPGPMQTNNDIGGNSPGAPIVLNVLANDQGNALTLASVGTPQHGTVIFDTRTITYTPAAGFQGVDFFTYQAHNNLGDTDVSTVTVNVNPVVQAPVASNDSFTVTAGTPFTGNVLTNDGDTDGDKLLANKVSDPGHGVLRFNLDGTFTYTATLGFTGVDTFTYQANDGRALSNVATVTLVVGQATQTAQTSVTIVLANQPQDDPRNFGFTSSQGAFLLDDVVPADHDAYTNTKIFPVAAGVYTFSEQSMANWFLTAITCNPTANGTIDLAKQMATITIANGNHVTCTFTNQHAGAIVAGAYADHNHNHVRNRNDEWQTGWTMELYAQGGSSPNRLVSTQVTDKKGRATFTNLAPGAYTLCEVLQTNWFNITPYHLDPAYNKPCYPITLPTDKAVWAIFGNSTTALTGISNTTNFPALTITDLPADDSGTWVIDPWADNMLFLPLVQR